MNFIDQLVGVSTLLGVIGVIDFVTSNILNDKFNNPSVRIPIDFAILPALLRYNFNRNTLEDEDDLEEDGNDCNDGRRCDS